MRPLPLLLLAALAACCVPPRAASPAAPAPSPLPAPATLSAAADPAAPLPAPRAYPLRALDAWVDSSLSDDRRLYWLRCASATASRRHSRAHALQGVALFLADIPVEYAASRHRHLRGTEPARLNALGFALLSAALWKLTLSHLAWQDYQRDRACCRHWQDFAQVNR